MPKKILIIEDDQDLLEALMLILSDEGFEPIGKREPGETLEITNLEPDLVLLDHGLAGKSGATLCKDLKADRPDLPVLLLSGHELIDCIATSCKADGYIRKPFEINGLVANVKAALGDSPE